MRKPRAPSPYAPPKPTPLLELAGGVPPDTPLSVKITGEVFLAIQLIHERWRSPEETLCLEVLSSGLKALIFFRAIQTIPGQRLYRGEYDWLMDESLTWPFSFQNLCSYFGFDAESVRKAVLKP